MTLDGHDFPGSGEAKRAAFWRGCRRRVAVLLLAVVAGAAGLPCCSHRSERVIESAAGMEGRASDLRIGTYNLYVKAHDLPGTVSVLKAMDADVIALQEVTPESAKGLDGALAGVYPYRFFSSGLGIVSRFPLRDPHFQKSPSGINGFLFAGVEHPQGRVQVANIHLDPLRLWTGRDLMMLPLQFGRNRTIQRAELVRVHENLTPDVPTLLVGDFNRVSDEVINKLRSGGFTDSFGEVMKDADRISTLHFSLLGMHFGKRIDFIFHDRHFHTVRSRVIPGLPSDHDAVVTRLAWDDEPAHAVR